MIIKKYEIWCDDQNHEPDGQLLIEAASKNDAKATIRKRGWNVTADGRTVCAECCSALTRAADDDAPITTLTDYPRNDREQP